MRVCFVTTQFIERGKPSTGLPNYLYRVSSSLLEMGHDVVVIVCGSYDKREVIKGICVYRCYVPVTGGGNEKYNFLINSLRTSRVLNRKVRELLDSEKPDIVQYTSLLGTGIFCPAGIPCVLRLSSYAKVSFGSYQTCSPDYVRLMSFVERLSAQRMNGIFAPSRVMAEAFGKDIGKKVTVIESPFEKEAVKTDESVYLQKLKGKKYILFFGSLYEEKGLKVIRDMIFDFLAAHPDYYYVLIGDIPKIGSGNLLDEIREASGRYRNRIIYNKALVHEQLYPIIQHAKVVTLPSLMENLSNACLEAMYLEKVVIGTDGASFEQLIRDGENGYLAKPGCAKSLYEKIEEAISLKEDARRKMEIKAGERIRRLSPEIAVARLLRYYETVISNKRKMFDDNHMQGRRL